METPERDVEILVRELAELRRELARERNASESSLLRVRELEARCETLAQHVELVVGLTKAFRRQPASQPKPEASPEPALVTPIAPARRDEVVYVPEEPPRRQAEARQATAAAKEASTSNLEATIGAYWFSRLGAISLLVGFVIFAGYVQQYITPPVRVGLCYLAAVALCGVGFWAERAYPIFARPVLAAGFMLAFFTSFAAHFIPPMQCMSLPSASVLILVTVVAVVVVAGVLRSQPLGALAIAMGLWVSVFATKLADAFTLVMLIFLCLIGATFLVAFRWPALMALAVVGVYGCDLWWGVAGQKTWQGAELFWVQIGFLTGYFLIFFVADIIARLRLAKASAPAERDSDALILVGRFINPLAYFLVGTLVFWRTEVFWGELHHFYWPLGLLLAVLALAWQSTEGERSPADDLYYVLATGLISLGFFSAFGAASLSNILAFEALCLLALYRLSGHTVFSVLSAVTYVVAYGHFHSMMWHPPSKLPDWNSFAASLPAVLFVLAPIVLTPLLARGKSASEDAAPRDDLMRFLDIPWPDERRLVHVRAVAGSLMLLWLFGNTVPVPMVYGAWILLVLATLFMAWILRRHAPGLWTLGGMFLLWAHAYLLPNWEKVQRGDPAWIFPASIIMALAVFAGGIAVEFAAGGRLYGSETGPSRGANSWKLLTAIIGIFLVLDVSVLLHLRASAVVQYPMAAGLVVGMMLLAVGARMAFPCAAAMPLLMVSSLMMLVHLLDDATAKARGLVAWTLLGIGLAVASERLFHAYGERLLRDAWKRFRGAPVLLLGLLTAILLLLVEVTPWIGRKYQTVGISGAAILLLGLGIALRSAVYRRFGLGVFVFALGRAYVVDLAQLETGYKIIAFIALGGTLILVSYLYTRFKEQFQKWV